MASGSSIAVGETAKIIARLENSGEAVSGIIHMVETSGNGTLAWENQQTGIVLVEGEITEAINDIVGQTQCVLSVIPDSVTGVWETTDLGEATGPNLLIVVGRYGRTIDLNTQLSTGTPLIAKYSKNGSVQNEIKGISAGVANVVVSADVRTEKGLTQTVQVTITAEHIVISPSPIISLPTSPLSPLPPSLLPPSQPVPPPPVPLLVPNTATVMVDTIPQGASITCGNISKGNAPVTFVLSTLPSYVVIASLPGYINKSTPAFRLVPGEVKHISLTLVSIVPPAPVAFRVQGPTVCKLISPYNYTYGPWSIITSDNTLVSNCIIQVKTGNGYFIPKPNGYLVIGAISFGQIITLTVSGTYIKYGSPISGTQVSADINVLLAWL